MLSQVPGVYTQEYSDAALSYPSTSSLDDMAYAAAWMYFSTQVKPIVSAYKHLQQHPKWDGEPRLRMYRKAGREESTASGKGAREFGQEVQHYGGLHAID